VRRKKPPALIDMISDSDDDEHKMKKKRIDFYLDREIDGYSMVRLAHFQTTKRAKDIVEWSGQDVLSKMDPYKVRLAVGALDTIRVWPYRIEGTIKKARVILRKIMNSGIVEHGMTLCVVGNTVVLSLDYYGASEAIQAFCVLANAFFTITFAVEMCLRIVAIGPVKWLADKMNYMDGTIVILSLVELLFMSGSGALSALRAVRIFRVFRVLRVARLLRGLKSMIQIINVISRSI
jgi:Ion transport protein